MGCCKQNCTPQWTTTLKAGLEKKTFVIQIKRYPKCCGPETFELFVNDQERDHQLACSHCSPYFGSGGWYEWDEDGHNFLLVLDKLSYEDCLGKFRLFVDGIDVETGKEFSDYWKRRGIKWLIIGLLYISISVVVCLILFVVLKLGISNLGSMTGLFFLAFWGIFHVVAAVMLFTKYSKPRASPSAVQDYETFQSSQIV